MKNEFLDGRIIVKVGDITKENVDAVVNAANPSLMGGGGVDHAIHKAAGPQLLEECRKIRENRFPQGLPTGEAVITSGGNLPAKYVIHTVGPVYGENQGKDPELLAACYENCIRVALENDVTSMAVPSISTGVYGYPKDEAAQISSLALRRALLTRGTIPQIYLVFFHDDDVEVFLEHTTLE